jgi:hypothetical protein
MAAPWLRKSASGEGNVLHVLEDGNEVLIMEMISGKLQVVAGTAERLFIKLADETAQGLQSTKIKLFPLPSLR